MPRCASGLPVALCLATLVLAAPGAEAARRRPAAEPPPATTAQFEAARAAELRLATARVEAASRLRDTEAAVEEHEAAVAVLSERRVAASARLDARAAAIGPLLPLVLRLALFPAETVLAVPGDKENALRGLVVLRGLARRLEAEAAALRRDRDALAADAAAVEAALPALRDARASSAEQGRALDAALLEARTRREQAEAAGLEAARRAAAEVARAESLRAALAAAESARARAEADAERERAQAERRRDVREAEEARQKQAALAPAPPPDKGGLLQPVSGAVARAWGAAGEGGPANGITFRAAPGARVVAPCAGRVRFAGPFRSYGALIILDCGGGTAFVLAGLGRLDVQPGVALLEGEPVGAMAEPGGAGPRPALYLELRRGGQAVDPAPFLRRRP